MVEINNKFCDLYLNFCWTLVADALHSHWTHRYDSFHIFFASVFQFINFVFECFTFAWKCDSILYVFEKDLSMLICIHSVGIEMFDLHELILCEFEGFFSKRL